MFKIGFKLGTGQIYFVNVLRFAPFLVQKERLGLVFLPLTIFWCAHGGDASNGQKNAMDVTVLWCAQWLKWLRQCVRKIGVI